MYKTQRCYKREKIPFVSIMKTFKIETIHISIRFCILFPFLLYLPVYWKQFPFYYQIIEILMTT